MKSEKGMTLITTVVLVIVIAALVFAVVYYARIQYAKENLEDLKTDMLLVQAKVQNMEGEYTLEKKDEVLKGTKISEMQEEQGIKSFIENSKIDIKEKGKKYYVLNKENLNELGLEQVNLEENCYYIVEYTKKEVYYSKGFTYTDGKTYYEINEIEKLNADENKEE